MVIKLVQHVAGTLENCDHHWACTSNTNKVWNTIIKKNLSIGVPVISAVVVSITSYLHGKISTK